MGQSFCFGRTRRVTRNDDCLCLPVIASKQNAGMQANVFALQFDRSMQLDQLQEELSFWCSKQLGELARRSASALLERVKAAPKWTSDEVVVNSIVFESNSTINTLATGSVRTHSSPYHNANFT